MAFLGRHQGYLSLRAGSPDLKQVASDDRAIGICNTDNMRRRGEGIIGIIIREKVYIHGWLLSEIMSHALLQRTYGPWWMQAPSRPEKLKRTPRSFVSEDFVGK